MTTPLQHKQFLKGIQSIYYCLAVQENFNEKIKILQERGKSMRIKSSKGITIKTPVKKKLTSNGYTPYINFNSEKANIIILSYQPGYGKTYSALKYMRQQNNANTFYFTNRHDTIDERIKDWNVKNKPLPTHWKGFDKICPERNNKSLYRTYKVSPGKLCEGCIRKTYCDYINQFKVSQRVFSPIEYLSKEKFKDKISGIKTIFVDERVSKVDVRSIDKKLVTEAFKTMKTPSYYITDIRYGNYSNFTKKKLEHMMDKYWNTIDTALQNDDTKTLEKLKDFNPSYFIEFLEWGNIYNFNKKKYGIPFYYYVFDALNENPNLKVVILDASFNSKLFKYFLYSYNGEKGFKSKIEVQEYFTDEQNKNTIIFKMRPKAWHPKASFSSKYEDKYAEKWVPEHLKRIREIFGNENVGIITFKELGEKSKFLGYNVEYYGNLRSKNTFENMPVLVVLGHFFPPMPTSRIDPKTGIKQKGLEEKDWKEKHLGDSWPRRYADKRGKTKFLKNDTVKLYPARTIQDYFDDEIYQAVHRSRGLLNKRIIFLYCWIPEKYLFHGGRHLFKIVEEFDFRKIERDEEDEFFQNLKDQIGNRKLVDDILDDINYKNKTNTKIAKERNISRLNLYSKPDGKSGIATTYIKVLKDGIYKRNVVKNKINNPKYKI